MIICSNEFVLKFFHSSCPQLPKKAEELEKWLDDHTPKKTANATDEGGPLNESEEGGWAKILKAIPL
jgi:hypothetical protein